jgi:hypothetical protein
MGGSADFGLVFLIEIGLDVANAEKSKKRTSFFIWRAVPSNPPTRRWAEYSVPDAMVRRTCAGGIVRRTKVRRPFGTKTQVRRTKGTGLRSSCHRHMAKPRAEPRILIKKTVRNILVWLVMKLHYDKNAEQAKKRQKIKTCKAK